jgi:hypothetical protein
MGQDFYLEWDRSEWAGIPRHPAPATAGEARWNKFQWVGERAQEPPRRWRAASDMPEGVGGFSGFRHNPEAQHWGRARHP